jgi:hypothetical protein
MSRSTMPRTLHCESVGPLSVYEEDVLVNRVRWRAVLKTRRVSRWWFLRRALSSRRPGLGPPTRAIAPTVGA